MGSPRVQRRVDLLLTPARVLSILRDFTLFEQVPGGGVRKLIPRYPQVEAAEAIHAAGAGRWHGKGLIWHYQGTGKSLLMAFAALMLLNDEAVGGPTVVVVLDRLDLIEQIERQFKTAGLPRVHGRGARTTCGGCWGRPARHRPDDDLPVRGRRGVEHPRQHHRVGG